MGERQPFRFRLPWLSMPAAPRPTTTATATTDEQSQVPTRPTATVPVQRPPFRPPGIAPVQPPPPASLLPPRIEPQPPASPTRAAIETRASSQPSSPSRLATDRVASHPASPTPTTQSRAASLPASPSPTKTQSRAASLPASPSPTTTQSKAASLPPSPSRAASQSQPASVPPSSSRIASEPQSPLKTAPRPAGQTSPQSSSPPRTASRVQPTAEVISLPPPPPSKILEPTTVVTSQPPRISTQPTSLATQQEEPEPALPQPVSRETQLKPEIVSETGAGSRIQPPVEINTQPDGIATLRSEAPGLVAAAAPRTVLMPFTHSKENPEETKEGPPKHKTDTEIPTVPSNSETQTKEQLNVAVKEQKELVKQENHGRKETSNTFDSNGKVFKSGKSTHPKERNHKLAFLNGERVPLHKEIREDISKFVHKLGTGHLNQTVNDKLINVITVAGENRGASMQLGSASASKEKPVHIRRGYKINPDESVDATTDAEGSSRGRRSKDTMTEEYQATKVAYINNNVQSINNSIVFNTSVSERNPGVQLDLSQNPIQPSWSNGKRESPETRKAEFNITPAEKLIYQPTVRRRCLRGLMMEPSDSDPDNPDHPRRHGCRYGCWEKGKDEDIGIL